MRGDRDGRKPVHASERLKTGLIVSPGLALQNEDLLIYCLSFSDASWYARQS